VRGTPASTWTVDVTRLQHKTCDKGDTSLYLPLLYVCACVCHSLWQLQQQDEREQSPQRSHAEETRVPQWAPGVLRV
jgi:hypothetical protein